MLPTKARKHGRDPAVQNGGSMSQGSQFLIAVCDDNHIDREQVVCLTQDYFRAADVECDVRAYDSGSALLAAIKGGEKYHLLILDVMMDQLDGMGLAAFLRRQKDDTAIVFISSNREMALRGYEVSAKRFLGKPLDTDKLHEALECCYQLYQENRAVLLPTAQGLRRISPADILCVEASERGTKVYLPNGRIDTSLRIFEYENILPQKQFILCHRAFVANLAAVQSIRRYELELNDGRIVPVSKHRYAFVRDRLVDYLKT